MHRSLLLAAPLCLLAAPAIARPDTTFLEHAMKGDNSEFVLGRMAMERGSSPRMRAYGRMLMRDHGSHKVRVAALARAMREGPTNEMTDDAVRARSMLSGLRGREFDRAFKQHMIEDHQKDITDYTDQGGATRDPRVRAFVRATLPVLRKHLAMARAL